MGWSLDKVVVVLEDGLPAGQAANVAACLAAGLAGAAPGLGGAALTDRAGLRSVASAQLPISVLRADPQAMAALVQRMGAAPAAGVVCLFPAYAQRVNDAAHYVRLHAQADHAQERLLGLGLAGARRWVNGLTGSLGLWR